MRQEIAAFVAVRQEIAAGQQLNQLRMRWALLARRPSAGTFSGVLD